jgi:Tfp pilus assembly protein PilZ
MSLGDEKRRSVRVPVDFPASFTHGEKSFSSRVLNLSVDGVLLRASELLDPGDPIHLTFDLGQQEIRVKGKVMWGGSVEVSSRTYGLGIQFDNISAIQQVAIEQYIRNLLKI